MKDPQFVEVLVAQCPCLNSALIFNVKSLQTFCEEDLRSRQLFCQTYPLNVVSAPPHITIAPAQILTAVS